MISLSRGGIQPRLEMDETDKTMTGQRAERAGLGTWADPRARAAAARIASLASTGRSLMISSFVVSPFGDGVGAGGTGGVSCRRRGTGCGRTNSTAGRFPGTLVGRHRGSQARQESFQVVQASKLASKSFVDRRMMVAFRAGDVGVGFRSDQILRDLRNIPGFRDQSGR